MTSPTSVRERLLKALYALRLPRKIGFMTLGRRLTDAEIVAIADFIQQSERSLLDKVEAAIREWPMDPLECVEQLRKENEQ